MIASLLLDCDESPDFPGGTGTAFGRPLAAYPMMAARGSAFIRRHYVVTASQPVKSVALQNDAIIVDPPPGNNHAREALLLHGYRYVVEDLKSEKTTLELLCVFAAQAPRIMADLVDFGVQQLQDQPTFDSAVSVSQYNRFHPFYAMREGAGGALEPFVRPYADKGGDVWFPDLGVQLLRPAVLEKLASSPEKPPFWWLGARPLALKQWGGGPVDYQWEIPAVEFWLRKHGVADLTPTMELQPKPQPLPQRDGRR